MNLVQWIKITRMIMGVGFEMYDNGENCSNSNNREDFEETMVDDATLDACN